MSEKKECNRKMEKLAMTKHAMTRYAERIAGRDELIDINIYIARSEEKIIEDINTMYEHSELIYTGKVGNRDNNPVNVYLSGTWIILTDLANSKVITLYKVEFNVGEEFNKQFIQKILDKLAEDKKILEEKRAEIAEEKSAYEQIIKDNEEMINEYRGTIKMLERNNADYRETIESMDSRCVAAELAVKRDIETLVMKREF